LLLRAPSFQIRFFCDQIKKYRDVGQISKSRSERLLGIYVSWRILQYVEPKRYFQIAKSGRI